MDKKMHDFTMPVESRFYQKTSNNAMRKSLADSIPNVCSPNATNPISSEKGMSLDDLPLAMAYVPFQKWGTVYEASHGLSRGTIFPDLDLPFEGRRIK
ncbi:MAG: spore coat associated protein CotJA [Anaerovoracaceae bacterium]